MSTMTRRGFVQTVGMTPLLAGAALAADTGTTIAAAADMPRPYSSDPYSYVDPEMAAALKKSGRNSEVPSDQNLAAWRAADKNSFVSSAPELQPRKLAIPGPAGQPDVNVLIIDPKPDRKNRPAVIYIH